MDRRKLQIIKCFETEDVVTIKEIQSFLAISEKTVRNLIKEIKIEIYSQGAEIVSIPGTGYHLNIVDKALFSSFIKNATKVEISKYESSEERILLILESFLINSGDYRKIEDLADELLVSRSTLNRDLSKVKEMLEKYHIKLISKPTKGVKIKGREMDLRFCLTEHIVRSHGSIGDSEAIFEKTVAILKEVLARYEFDICDFSFHNLTMHLYIAIIRCQKGYMIKIDSEQLKQLQVLAEYRISIAIVQQIETKMNLQLSDDEIGYITLHLASKKLVNDSSISKNGIKINKGIQITVKEIIDSIYKNYHLDLRNDLDFNMALCMHFITLDVRLRYDLSQNNPILQEIKKKYNLAYIISQSTNSLIFDKYGKYLTEDEIAYIALHINLAIDRMHCKKAKKDIVIVCSTGGGTSQLLKYEYQKRFKNSVRKIYVIDRREMETFDFQSVDYVFSTIDIQEQMTRPIIYISPLFEDKDEARISTLIEENSLVLNFFSESLFFPMLDVADKQQVLEVMVDKISNVKKIPPEFLQLIEMREALGITNMGNHVAFPHPMKPCVDETFVAVATLKKAISWGESKVQMIYLLALTKRSKEEGIPLLFKVTGELLLSTKDIEDIILKSSYEVFINHIKKTVSKIGE